MTTVKMFTFTRSALELLMTSRSKGYLGNVIFPLNGYSGIRAAC